MWKLSFYTDHCVDTAIGNVRLSLQRRLVRFRVQVCAFNVAVHGCDDERLRLVMPQAFWTFCAYYVNWVVVLNMA